MIIRIGAKKAFFGDFSAYQTRKNGTRAVFFKFFCAKQPAGVGS
jgi:hypothetical protein